MRLPVARDETRALAVNEFKTLSDIGEADTASARQRFFAGQTGTVVFHDNAQHIAIAARCDGDQAAIYARGDGVFDRVL